MTALTIQQLPGFLKRYRFRGAKLLRLSILRQSGDKPNIDVLIRVRESITDLSSKPAVVRLRLRLRDVSEFQVRKRPNDERMTIRKTDMSYSQGQFFINFDSYLSDDEKPEIHDYRASDLYFACAAIEWEIVPKPTPGA